MNAPTYPAREALPLFVDYFKRPACQAVVITVRPDGVVATPNNDLCCIDPAALAVETVTEARRIAQTDLADPAREVARAEYWERGWKRLLHTETLDVAFADRLLEWKEGVIEKTRKQLAEKATA